MYERTSIDIYLRLLCKKVVQIAYRKYSAERKRKAPSQYLLIFYVSRNFLYLISH